MHLIYGPTVEIVVGDDIERAARDGLLKEIRLEVGVSKMHMVEGINIKVNGKRVPAGDVERVAKSSFGALLQPSSVKRGINRIELLPGPRSTGRFSSKVTGLKLWVRYKHDQKGPVTTSPGP